MFDRKIRPSAEDPEGKIYIIFAIRILSYKKYNVSPEIKSQKKSNIFLIRANFRYNQTGKIYGKRPADSGAISREKNSPFSFSRNKPEVTVFPSRSNSIQNPCGDSPSPSLPIPRGKR